MEQKAGDKNREAVDNTLRASEIYLQNEQALHDLFVTCANSRLVGILTDRFNGDYSKAGTGLKANIIKLEGLDINSLGTDFASLAALTFENMVLRFVQINRRGGKIRDIGDTAKIKDYILDYIQTITKLKDKEKINCEGNDLPTIGFEIEIPKSLFFGDELRYLSSPYLSFLNGIGLVSDQDDGHLESRSLPTYSHDATVETMKQFYDFAQLYLMNGLHSLQKNFRLSDYELPLHINYCIEDIARTPEQKENLKYDQVGKNILGIAMGSFMSSKRLEGHHYDNTTVGRSHVAFIPNNSDNSIATTQKTTHNTRVEIRVMELDRSIGISVEAGQYLTYAYSMAKKQEFGHELNDTQKSIAQLWREFEDYITFNITKELFERYKNDQDLYVTRREFDLQSKRGYATTKATVLHDNSRYVWDFLSNAKVDQSIKASVKSEIKFAVVTFTKKLQLLQSSSANLP